MQIVIDIPEELYIEILGETNQFIKNVLHESVKNGTPLPKEHGELVDRNAINDRFDFIYEFAENNMHSPSDKYFFDKLYMCLNTAPTIIKAENK